MIHLHLIYKTHILDQYGEFAVLRVSLYFAVLVSFTRVCAVDMDSMAVMSCISLRIMIIFMLRSTYLGS